MPPLAQKSGTQRESVMKRCFRKAWKWFVSCVMAVLDALYAAASQEHDPPAPPAPSDSGGDSSSPEEDSCDSSSDSSSCDSFGGPYDDPLYSGPSRLDPDSISDDSCGSDSDSDDYPCWPEPTWTRETSFALVIAHDYLRDTYPVYTTNRIRDIFGECAGTVRFVVDADATAEAFLDALREGLKYKTFFFYEYAHGNNKCVRMADRNLLSREIWDVMRNATNRIVGFFDSCYSGSMLEDPGSLVPRGAGEGTMADFLVQMFKEQEEPAREILPRIRLYSACANGVVTTYEPGIGTKFADAILMAYRKSANQTYADFDKILIEKGSYGNSPKIDPKYHVVPQIAIYGEDFSGYMRLR